jgi:hypothetical protein
LGPPARMLGEVLGDERASERNLWRGVICYIDNYMNI